MRDFDGIIPIPLHPTRLREGGFNQAQLLAQGLSESVNVPHWPDVLIRSRPTRYQALLKEKDRWTNIHGAFRIRNPQKVIKKSVLLVDDLFTTGATLSEAASVLRRAGARKVYALTAAVAS